MRSGRIEVCGGIASGKTTLAQLLVRSDVPGVFENFETNPFWKLFYAEPMRYAFETEVTFLLQHYSQLRDAEVQFDEFVFDSSFVQDAAYAGVNLSGTKNAAFMAVHDEVVRSLSPPALLVHLRCPAEEELRRIRARGRPEESGIAKNYLETLDNEISRCVASARTQMPVLEIDSLRVDFVNEESASKRISKLVLSAARGASVSILQ